MRYIRYYIYTHTQTTNNEALIVRPRNPISPPVSPPVFPHLGPILNGTNINVVPLLSRQVDLTFLRVLWPCHKKCRISAVPFEKRGFLENSALIQNDKFHGRRRGGNTLLACVRLFIVIRMFADRSTGCFWRDDARLICGGAECLNTTCTRVRTPSSVLPPCMWQRPSLFLPLSLYFFPPPPPVIRLFTGTTTDALPWTGNKHGAVENAGEISAGAPHPRSSPGCPSGRRVCCNDNGFRFQPAVVVWSFLAEFVECPFFPVQSSPSRLFAPNSLITAVLCRIAS